MFLMRRSAACMRAMSSWLLKMGDGGSVKSEKVITRTWEER